MKRGTLIAVLTAIMIMACSVFSFADDGLKLVSSYPEDGQTNTSMENLGVKLTFNNPINSEEAKKVDASKFSIIDEDGKKVPIQVLFSDKNDGLVLVVADNMGMMFIMFGGIMVLTLRQNNKKEEEQVKEEPKEAFNPYREAKRTGKSVEEVMAEQAKKEEKLAKKRARKNKNKEAAAQEGKIENCAELLNNVYHVHAPAPISKEDRSVNTLISMRKEAARAEKAEKAAQAASRARKKRK